MPSSKKGSEAKSTAAEATTQVVSPAPDIRERWEVLFVYAFITRFTNLKEKIPTLNSPMDFEDALVFPGTNTIIYAILQRFLTNLLPNCDTKPESIERATSSAIDTLFNTSKERSIWWNETKGKNINPLKQVVFFAAPWDIKLQVLRQLVEWQLTYSTAVKPLIDDAWGIKHVIKTKSTKDNKSLTPGDSTKQTKGKGKAAKAVTTVTEPLRKKDLEFVPVGLDSTKRRFWVADDSPRVWSSSNPWKTRCPFTAVASSRDEYIQVLENLRTARPPVATGGGRRGKFQLGHDKLISKLEERSIVIDEELARLEKVKKRLRDKEAALARAMELVELRQTRTRTRKAVDYAAIENAGESDEDDGGQGTSDEDEWKDTENETRRSSRQTLSSRASSAAASESHKRKRTSEPEWRGERRSSRLARGRYQVESSPEAGGSASDHQSTEQSLEEDVNSDDDVVGGGANRSKKRRVVLSPEPEDEDAPMTDSVSILNKLTVPTHTGSATASTISGGVNGDDDQRSSLETASLLSDQDPTRLSPLTSLSSEAEGC